MHVMKKRKFILLVKYDKMSVFPWNLPTTRRIFSAAGVKGLWYVTK